MNKGLMFLGASVAVLSMASTAWAADAGAASASVTAASSADGAGSIEEVIVYGRGETRQLQTVTQADILSVAPGSSPIKVIAKLPSVNFQSADPFGAYEWAVRISVRGFNQNQLGFTLDDVPLGDMTYNNFNGLHISRAVSSENLGAAQLAQGAGAIDTASSSNLGGTLMFRSLDPSEEFGGVAVASYGSDDTYHGFLRLESGLLPGGGRGYASVGYHKGNKWKGYGKQEHFQVNTKFVQPLGAATLTAFVNYSERKENDYQDLSLDLIRRLGYKADNISNDWATAVAIANAYQQGKPFPAPYRTPDEVYFDAMGLRRDVIGALRLDWQVAENLKLKTTVYGHRNDGQGHWDSPYVPSYLALPGGAPISMSSQNYRVIRKGVVASLSYDLGERNTVEGGFWFENNHFYNPRVYYALDATGTNRPIDKWQKDPFFVQRIYDYHIKTRAYHLQDTWRVTDDLKVNFGFKALEVSNDIVTRRGSPLINGEITAKKSFLPQVGLNYRLNESGEIFAAYAENMRAFTTAPFQTSQAGFDLIKNSLQPETSQSFEAGYRFHSGSLEGVVAGYYVKFKDRLVSTRVGPAILGGPTALANVGGVTSKGLEATGTWKFADDWRLFGSYAYNDASYDDDVVTGAGVLVAAIAGKTVVDSPKHLSTLELSYDNGALFGSASASHQSKRYYSYTNDASVPSRTLVDLSLGYRFRGDGWTDGLEIQANVANLFDKKYVSTIGTLGYPYNDPNGTFQNLLVGSPRSAFVTVRKTF